MPIAFNSSATRDYTLKDDTTGTIFKIGLIDSFARSFLENLLAKIRNRYLGEIRGIVMALSNTEIKPEERQSLEERLLRAQSNYEREQVKVDPNDETHFFLELLRMGLKGWTAFLDADGKEIPFIRVDKNIPFIGPRQIASDGSLMYLKESWMMELSLQIYKDNFINDQELKN